MRKLSISMDGGWFWLLPGLAAWLLALLTGFDGLYGQDSFEYLRYARELHAWIVNGSSSGIFEWPVLYPLTGAILSFLLKDVLALQLISISGFALSGLFLEMILRQLYPDHRGTVRLYLILFYVLCPFLLRYSLTVMSDLLAICFVTASWYAYCRFLKNRRPVHFFWLVTASVAATLSRYPAAIVLVIPLLHALILYMRRFQWGWFLGAVAVFCALLALEEVLHGRMVESVTGKASLQAWSVLNYFRTSFDTADGRLHYPLPNLVSAFRPIFHPGFIFAGLLLLLMVPKKGLSGSFPKAIGASFLLYTLFMAGLGLQNDRLLLVNFPLVVVFLCGSFIRLAEKIQPWFWLRIVLFAGIVIFQTVLCYRAFRPFLCNNREARFLAGEILKYPGKTVYTFNVDAALITYGVTSPVISLYTDLQDRFEPGALVLFNPSASYMQWAGHAPMNNWEHLVRQHHLKPLKSYPDGWILCQIGY